MLITILIIILALLALTAGLSYILWRIGFYSALPRREDPYAIPKGAQYQKSRERTLRLIREFDQRPFEPVIIRSFDGLELYGRYYHVKDGAPVQIQFHGYRGTALRDFCGGSRLAMEAGHNCLVVDQRSHGKSQGKCICFGIKERYDCLAWAGYAAERFGGETPIVLSGVSMGAATVLMAAELDLPGNVRCIIADCPYSSPEGIIRKFCARIGILPGLVFPLIALGARLYGGFSIRASSAIASVARTELPILLIHGEADHFVPCSMSREIAAACKGPVRLETFPKAGHGLSYIVDSRRYERVVNDFLASCGL